MCILFKLGVSDSNGIRFNRIATIEGEGMKQVHVYLKKQE